MSLQGNNVNQLVDKLARVASEQEGLLLAMELGSMRRAILVDLWSKMV
jgi:hypothetical protein